MDVVGSDTVVEQRDLELKGSLPEASAIFGTVNCEPQEKTTIVAAVRQVIDISGEDVSVGTRHVAPFAERSWMGKRPYEKCSLGLLQPSLTV